MKVRIFELNDQAQPEELGAIVLKAGQLVAEPERLALRRLIEGPLIVYEGKERVSIDPRKEPIKFLQRLTRAIRGSYFWAGKLEE